MTDVSPVWSEAHGSDPEAMEEGWEAVLGPSPAFPRELLVRTDARDARGQEIRYNESAADLDDYLALCEELAPRRDLWVGWCAATTYEEKDMDRVFGDIDSDHDLQDALERARRYEEHCMDVFGVRPAALFSCGKGFHLHFTHDPVPFRGRAYSDALSILFDPSRSYPDVGPLKHRRAKPRVPYSINLKATGRETRPMFVVPVDLAWDLKDIMRAARSCRVEPFTVPHSREAANLISPIASKVDGRLREARMSRQGSKDHRARVEGIIRFCEENGPNLVDHRGRPDGRRRLLHLLYVPALMQALDGDEDKVVERARTFMDSCGAEWRAYAGVVEGAAKGCVMDDGSLRMPMGLRRFFMESPGLRFPS